jgi:ribosome recycling factor
VAEEYRVSIRNHRRDANERLKKLQKDKEISEDDVRTVQDQVQKATNEHIGKVDKVLKAKEDEIMEV